MENKAAVFKQDQNLHNQNDKDKDGVRPEE